MKKPDGYYCKPIQILEYLKLKPDLINDKKFHELIIGYIMVEFLNLKQRESALIGFPFNDKTPIKEIKKSIPLDSLLSNSHKFIEDRDTDLLISIPEQNIRTKWQIVRYTHPIGVDPKRTLYQLIEKKCKMNPNDTKINLVVSIEKTPIITTKEIQEIIREINVPFGTVVLIRKASKKKGHFHYIQIYPSVISGKEIIIPLPV